MNLCAGRRIELQFQGASAHPWLLGRRYGLARGIYYRLAADGRSSSEQIPSAIQFTQSNYKTIG